MKRKGYRPIPDGAGGTIWLASPTKLFKPLILEPRKMTARLKVTPEFPMTGGLPIGMQLDDDEDNDE